MSVTFNDNSGEQNQSLLNDLNECHKKIEFLQRYRKTLIDFSDKCVCLKTSGIKSMVKTLESHYKSVFNESQTYVTERDSREEIIISNEELNENSSEVNQTYDKQICDKSDDNLVLVFDRRTNSIVRKRSDRIDTNIEFVINKLVIKRPEESINDCLNKTDDSLDESTAEKILQSQEEVSEEQEIRIQVNEEVVPMTTDPQQNSSLVSNTCHTISSRKMIIESNAIPLESVAKKPIIRSHSKLSVNQNRNESDIKSNIKLKTSSSIGSQRIKTRNTILMDWSEDNTSVPTLRMTREMSQKLKQLTNDLKSGTIDSFIDPNNQLIEGFYDSNPNLINNCFVLFFSFSQKR